MPKTNTLTTAAGGTLIALAVLDVSNGELSHPKELAQVAVAAGSLAALILGISLCLLARFARRRLPGAVPGMWLVGLLSLPYLLVRLLNRLTDVAVEMALPGGEVLATARLQAVLDDLRPDWYGQLDATLSIACTVLLIAAAATRRRARATAEPPTALVAGAPSDPWSPTRIDESVPDQA